jgi:hypothetical protein
LQLTNNHDEISQLKKLPGFSTIWMKALNGKNNTLRNEIMDTAAMMLSVILMNS